MSQQGSADWEVVTAPDYNQIKAKFDKSLQAEQFISNFDSSRKPLPNALHCIGQTPVVKMDRFVRAHDLPGEILGKCEFLNVGGSVKDRAALGLSGIDLRRETGPNNGASPAAIVEASSGNTGVGLAMLAAVQGRRCVVSIGDTVPIEKEVLLRALGATVVRARKPCPWYDPQNNHALAHQVMARMIANGIDVEMGDQYSHPGNRTVHYLTTAEEILNQTRDRPVDYLVVGAGTGGTIAGLARKFKEVSPQTKIVAVEPEGSIIHLMCEDRFRGIVATRREFANNFERPDLPAQIQPGQDVKEINALAKPWRQEGIGRTFFPPQLDPDDIDSIISIPDKEAFHIARQVIRTEGLLIGASSGSAIAAALRILKSRSTQKNYTRIVVILPDGSRNYLTHFLDDGWSLIHEYMTFQAYRAEHRPATGLFGGTSMAEDPFYCRPIRSVLEDIKVDNLKKVELSTPVRELLADYCSRSSKELKYLVLKVLQDAPNKGDDQNAKIFGVISWIDLQEAVGDSLLRDISENTVTNRPVLDQLAVESDLPLRVSDILRPQLSKILSPENTIGDLLLLTAELQRIGPLRDPPVVIHMGLTGLPVHDEVHSCQTFKKPTRKHAQKQQSEQSLTLPPVTGSKYVIVLRSKLLKAALGKWLLHKNNSRSRHSFKRMLRKYNPLTGGGGGSSDKCGSEADNIVGGQSSLNSNAGGQDVASPGQAHRRESFLLHSKR